VVVHRGALTLQELLDDAGEADQAVVAAFVACVVRHAQEEQPAHLIQPKDIAITLRVVPWWETTTPGS
jgi:hypothetical protein